jgi:hypothetical protein
VGRPAAALAPLIPARSASEGSCSYQPLRDPDHTSPKRQRGILITPASEGSRSYQPEAPARDLVRNSGRGLLSGTGHRPMRWLNPSAAIGPSLALRAGMASGPSLAGVSGWYGLRLVPRPRNRRIPTSRLTNLLPLAPATTPVTTTASRSSKIPSNRCNRFTSFEDLTFKELSRKATFFPSGPPLTQIVQPSP